MKTTDSCQTKLKTRASSAAPALPTHPRTSQNDRVHVILGKGVGNVDEGCVRETKRARVPHDDEESTKKERAAPWRRRGEHEHGEMGRDRRPGERSQWKGFITKFHSAFRFAWRKFVPGLGPPLGRRRGASELGAPSRGACASWAGGGSGAPRRRRRRRRSRGGRSRRRRRRG